MQTKKEKLLSRPWIVQRYFQHREKVRNAQPAIDFHQPADYGHIVQKLKKTQREKERQHQIEKENIRLLQSLGSIMVKKRMEDFWRNPRPEFLSRELIYGDIRPKTTPYREIARYIPKCSPTPDFLRTANRCSACSGRHAKRNQVAPEIPQNRSPWLQTGQSKNVKILNDTSELHKCCRFCC